MRKILNSEQSKEIALATISELAAPVAQTLGPGGNPIVLQQYGQNPDGSPKWPLITKDGVTVAEHVMYRSPAKNTFAQAIIQVAKNTVNQAGDGTTTAIVLANAMFQEGYKHIKQGVNGIQLYDQLKSVKSEIIKKLEERATPLKDTDLFDVALISANGDRDVAEKVAAAIKAVGEDGHVDLQEGFSRDTTLELVEGAMYKQGWRKFGPLGSLMVSDKVRNVCELERPAVLLYAGEIKTIEEVTDFLKNILGIAEDGGFENVMPVLIIAYDFADDVKNFIIQLRVQAKLPIAAIKSPFDGSPNARTQMLEDLSVLLGGQVTAKGIISLTEVKDEHLGCCEKVEIGPEETVFFKGHGEDTAILSRVDDLKKQLETIMYDFDKENIRLRIGKLTGGIAVIRVGGDSELEMKERKDRIEDALCASKVAIAEGILPGGGISLYNISNELEGDSIAVRIMREALKAPIRQIILNVGEDPARILTEMRYQTEGIVPCVGYDARKKEFVNDMIAAGIVDPLKVTKSALENAVSIVGLLLTTGGAIVADTEPKDGMANPLAGLLG